MIQFAVRIGSILLICLAATPAVAGPRGGAFFGGGGAHLGAGAFAAPHIASPSVTAPHFSSPSPHSARNIRTPLTAPVTPQLFARPGSLLQRVTPGQVGSAPFLRSVRQIPRPANQAANAFCSFRRPSVSLEPNPTQSRIREPACAGAHRLPGSLRAIFFPASPTFFADNSCWLHRTAVLAICVQ